MVWFWGGGIIQMLFFSISFFAGQHILQGGTFLTLLHMHSFFLFPASISQFLRTFLIPVSLDVLYPSSQDLHYPLFGVFGKPAGCSFEVGVCRFSALSRRNCEFKLRAGN